MNAIDTNIWLYSHDSRDPPKQRKAQALIATTRPLALPWQVGCEFVAASRKLAPAGFTEDSAWQSLQAMQQMADVILLPVPGVWLDTYHLHSRYSLSFWDALLAAACIHDGVPNALQRGLRRQCQHRQLDDRQPIHDRLMVRKHRDGSVWQLASWPTIFLFWEQRP
jgi:predicted nucleic acid-binding protein